MYFSSSTQVTTPGVLSVVSVYAGRVHFSGYAPTSLHISMQMPASLFCTMARDERSSAEQEALAVTSRLRSTAPWTACTDARIRVESFIFGGWCTLATLAQGGPG